MSWLVDYLYYTQRQESPEHFHFWTGITTIAAAMGRNVWLNRRSGGVTRYQIFPGQMMTIFVAGSAKVRKTTAVNPSKKFLKHIGKKYIAGKSSPEAFLDQMDPVKGGTPQAVLIESEITVFICKSAHTEPIVDILIKLHDADDDFPYETRGGGKILIPKPCLTLFGATTPESLGDRLPTSAHGSGFMSRVIPIYGSTTDRVESLTDVEDTDVCKCGVVKCKFCRGNPAGELAEIAKVEKRLFDEIKTLSQLAGPYTYTPAGKKWFEEFYHKWRKNEGATEGFPSRRPDHLLRIAMIITASKNHQLELDDKSFIIADRLLTSAEKDFDKCFAFVGTVFAKDRQRLIEFITAKAGKVTVNEIFQAMYPFFQDHIAIRRSLNLLKEAGVLIQTFSSTHPPQEYWSIAGLSFKI